MLNNCYKILLMLAVASFLSVACSKSNEESIPNLLGEWKGINHTVSDAKGFQEWEKVITISEQQDRRFRGHFEYSEGSVKFFGVIFPDNIGFAWVSENSKGYNVGKIMETDKISSCYIEAGEQATAGCVTLIREPNS